MKRRVLCSAFFLFTGALRGSAGRYLNAFYHEVHEVGFRISHCGLRIFPLSAPLPLSAWTLCRNPRNLIDVMLSNAKHLAFSSCYEVEILRLRLRMTLQHSLLRGIKEGDHYRDAEFTE